MGKKYSLQEIIDSVIFENIQIDISKDNGEDLVNANRRWLRRSFEKLINKLGCNKEIIKDKNKTFEFDELEMPTIKVLVSSFFDKESLISKFVNKKNDGEHTSSEDVYKFLCELKKEIEKDDTMDKENLEYLLQYLSNIFLYSPSRSIENCHNLINKLANELKDFDVDQQSIYLGKVEHILKKEVALRIAESAEESVRIAERIKYGKHAYYEKEPEIQFLYKERDRKILQAIQEDDDFRYYIEKKIGIKAEKIFNYATLNR